MKLTFLLTVVCFLQTSATAYSQATKFSFEMKNQRIQDVLREIEKNSDFRFFYQREQVDVEQIVTMNVTDKTVEEILPELFEEQEVVFDVRQDNLILIKPAQGAIESSTEFYAQQQQKSVSGKVTDSGGQPLPGVTVVVKGTTQGAVTNADGNYTVTNVPNDAILQFSFVGMKAQEIEVGNQTSINITMEEDAIGIEEVVAIGYGTVKKSDLTGAVSSVSRRDLGDRLVSNLGSLIQGKAAGVDVSRGQIRIRGLTSFYDDSPLIVIDGFIGGNLGTVNPNDIENIEILKDASSTAIYGSKGANGVILITTRKGVLGRVKFNVDYKEGFSDIPKKLDVMNADQLTDYAIEFLEDASIAVHPAWLSGETRVDRTDWQNEVFRTGHERELNMNFSGGSEKATYFLSLGYHHSENQTFVDYATNNLFLRSKNDFDIKDWLRIGNNIALSFNSNGGDASGNLDWLITDEPYLPAWNADGTPYINNTDRSDPFYFGNLTLRTPLYAHSEDTGLNYQVGLYTEVEPVKGLIYRAQVNASGYYGKGQSWHESWWAEDRTYPSQLSKNFIYAITPIFEQFITYKNAIGKHDFSVMAGNLWSSYSKGGNMGIFGQDIDVAILNVTTAGTQLVIRDDIWKAASLAYFGRVNYQFNNKYLLTANFRADASAKFAPANRWATFPSVSLAWKMHEETFIKNLNIFDQLKMRAGTGTSGSDNIGEFRYLSRVWTRNVYVPFGDAGTRALGATVLNNSSKDIRWETTKTTSVGADMAFLNYSLTFSADYYHKETYDILYEIPQPISMGYGSNRTSGNAVVNAASMENKGIELQIGYRSKIGQVNYWVDANYTNNKNNVISLGEGSYIDGINRTEIGYPLGYFYGYVADGIFMTQTELDAANNAAKAKGWPTYQDNVTRAGDVRFKDIDGDGRVTDEDRTYLGTPHPKHLYGLNLNLDYKGFDMNVQLQGIGGTKIYSQSYSYLRGGQQLSNQLAYVIDRWKSEAEPGNGIVPRIAMGDPARNNRFSTLLLDNGNYLKIRQISLGYTMPGDFSNKIGIDKIRTYVSADNYFTFSKTKWIYDPEVGGSNMKRGGEWLSRPRPKLLMFGVQISL